MRVERALLEVCLIPKRQYLLQMMASVHALVLHSLHQVLDFVHEALTDSRCRCRRHDPPAACFYATVPQFNSSEHANPSLGLTLAIEKVATCPADNQSVALTGKPL